MYRFKFDQNKHRHVHFIGIGGISMSGLAEIMLDRGYEVTGTDSKESDVTRRLQSIGIHIYYSHKETNIDGADLVVYTDAIALDNIELRAAIAQKVDLVDRATFLGAIMENYRDAIAISGTHGKTTTTSMVTNIIHQIEPTPTILLGGLLDNINGNVLIGDNDLLLTEACEYKANILKYRPTIAAILNIDEDHLDYFDNIDHIVRTFRDYILNIEDKAKLILNIDDSYVKKIYEELNGDIVTVSLEEGDYQASEIDNTVIKGISFRLKIRGEDYGRVQLKVMGIHNITNALTAIAVCHEYGLSWKTIKQGIESYEGVKRRLELKASIDNIDIVDDYAHHPTEIRATLHAVKPSVEGKLYCIFQPHTFTRTKILLTQFSQSFLEADEVIITDIYAAREKDYGDIHSKTLVDAIKQNQDTVHYISSFQEVVDYLKDLVEPGDTVLTMGAGDVYEIGEMLIKELESREQ